MCGWDAWSTRSACGPTGVIYRQSIPNSSWVGLPLESMTWLTRSMSLWYILIQALAATHCLQVMKLMNQSPRWNERNRSLSQHPPQLRKRGSHSHSVTFLHRKTHGHWAEGRVPGVKVKLFLPYWMHPMARWNFSTGLLDFHQHCLTHGWFIWPRGAGDSS